MKKINLKMMKLTVFKENEKGTSFYKKHGFVLAKESYTDDDEENYYIL